MTGGDLVWMRGRPGASGWTVKVSEICAVGRRDCQSEHIIGDAFAMQTEGRMIPRHAALLPASLVSLALLAAGCRSGNDDLVQLEAFLQQDRSPVCGTEYRVMPPDVIALTSRHVPEIDGVVQRVRPDGMVSLPLVGELFVAGRTPSEIEAAISKAARRYYTLVDVTVEVREYASQKIYVFGEVLRPGPQPWTGADTLLDILARVQPTLLAWPERIKVVRAAEPARGGYLPEEQDFSPVAEAGRTETGAQTLTVDLMRMVKAGDMSHNILLKPNDVVYVPPNPFASVGLGLRQVLFPAKPVLEAARVPITVDDAADVFR